MMKSRTALGVPVLALAAGSSWLASSSVPELLAQGAAPVDTFRVVKTYPHDATAYTQGLIYREAFLFESTGLNGQPRCEESSSKPVRWSSSIVSTRPISPRGWPSGTANSCN
jgi:glutaminyl-peptide cyclotransferase